MFEHMMFDVVGTTRTMNYAVVFDAVVMLQVLMLCHLCVVAQNLFGLMVMKHELDVLFAKACCCFEHCPKIYVKHFDAIVLCCLISISKRHNQ